LLFIIEKVRQELRQSFISQIFFLLRDLQFDPNWLLIYSFQMLSVAFIIGRCVFEDSLPISELR
jgi:hypothetical protein